MGKCWTIESGADFELDDIRFEVESLREIYHVKVTEYPSNPLEPIKDVSLLAKRIVQNREADVGINYLNSHELDLYSLAKAIQKAMVILGGE